MQLEAGSSFFQEKLETTSLRSMGAEMEPFSWIKTVAVSGLLIDEAGEWQVQSMMGDVNILPRVIMRIPLAHPPSRD